MVQNQDYNAYFQQLCGNNFGITQQQQQQQQQQKQYDYNYNLCNTLFNNNPNNYYNNHGTNQYGQYPYVNNNQKALSYSNSLSPQNDKTYYYGNQEQKKI